MKPCHGCGQIEGIPEYDAELWSLYHRLDDGGRKFIEPLVYTQSDMEEAGAFDDEESFDAVMLSMGRNMHERGLCSVCGRPDLTGIPEDRFMSEEDADELAEMYAEMAAEQRMGA